MLALYMLKSAQWATYLINNGPCSGSIADDHETPGFSHNSIPPDVLYRGKEQNYITCLSAVYEWLFAASLAAKISGVRLANGFASFRNGCCNTKKVRKLMLQTEIQNSLVKPILCEFLLQLPDAESAHYYKLCFSRY